MSSQERSEPSREPVAHYLLAHYRLLGTIVLCAALVVASDSPGRLDLWTADFFGTAILLGVAPLLAMRWLKLRESIVLHAVVMMLAFGLAQAKATDREEQEAPAMPVQQPLPTASDGFGAWPRTTHNEEK